MKDLLSVMKIADDKTLQRIQIKTAMDTIHSTFRQKDLKGKELALDEYIDLLSKRIEVDNEITDVQIYLDRVSDDLNSGKYNFLEKLTHNKNIKDMKKQINTTIRVVEDECEKIAEPIDYDIEIIDKPDPKYFTKSKNTEIVETTDIAVNEKEKGKVK